MATFTVTHRLEINYYSRDYKSKCCETSAPVRGLEEGLAMYEEAIKKPCIDKPNRPARVHLWEYAWDSSGKCTPVTIRKNY